MSTVERRAAAARRPERAKAHPRSRIEQDARLGATLMRLGKLNEEALSKITELQRSTNAPFARAASRLGFITKDDVETALGVQNGLIRENEGEGRAPADAVVVRRPRCREAEQFRALRTRLLTSKEADRLNLFSIASVGGAAEADHVTINMAAAFAQLGKRVILVDADLRACRLASRFGMPPAPGMIETLGGGCDIRNAIRQTVIANLSVITSGAANPTAHELLSGNTLPLIFEYLKCAYDIVIVTTAPYGLIADAQFTWAATGSVFVVTRRNEDRLPELATLNGALRQVDAAIIGAALAG